MTMNKVAKRVGVCHGTVSRVVNSRPGISPDTIRAVRLAMVELGYDPPPPEKRRGRTAAPNVNTQDAAPAALLALTQSYSDVSLVETATES
jgi:LacI family transcriptional regulator